MKKTIISVILSALMVIAPAALGYGAEAADAVTLTKQGLTVNGQTVQTQAYNINGNNYFKLRDVAAMVGGTSSQFDVGYDEANHVVTVTKGQSYEAQGNENKAGEGMSSTCVKSSQRVTINGREVDMTAYNIGGNNYFKLRDLGMTLGFYVDYDAAAAKVRISTPDALGDAGWMSSYREAVSSARYDNIGGSFLTYDENDAVSYQLYDIDKDGVPELFMHYGFAEAGRYMKIYTYKNDEMKLAGEIECGHTSLYSWPGENACALYWGHMGYASLSKISLENGEIKVAYGLFEEDIGEGDYTPLKDLVAGSKILDDWRIDIELPILQYRDVLQSAQGYECPKWADDGTARAQIMDTINNNGELFFLCSDAYGDEGGYMRFDEALDAGGPADNYSKKPLTPSYYAWADVNNDGTDECIVKLSHAADDTSSDMDVYAVMSCQNGDVYAYTVSYFDGKVLQNGVFVDDYDYGVYEYARRVMFSGVVGYTCYVEETGSTPEVEWIKY
ncbi:MAG: hypothetical protein IJG50_02405 [Clostridia bacterium]|nr:hypothetical protein [Clostridia bacterium]